MKSCGYLLVLIIAIAAVVCDKPVPSPVEPVADEKAPPPPEPPRPNPEPTSTHKPTSTIAPTTPSSTTTTSTTPPSTTSSTTPPTTSPTSPTTSSTSSTATSTTTSATSPTSTSTLPTTTSTPVPPKPPTPIHPTIGKWAVTQNGTSCVLVSAALQLQVPYITKANSTYKAYVNVPANATASGSCSTNDSSIIMEWNKNTVFWDFAKNGTKYYLRGVNATVIPDAQSFPFANDTKPINLKYAHETFETTVDKSYKCNKEQLFNLTNHKVVNGVFSISDFQFEAFHNSTNQEFASAEDCAPFDTPDIVPIGVGCALAALVLIVLAAYLIGRRRRQAHGYLSM